MMGGWQVFTEEGFPNQCRHGGLCTSDVWLEGHTRVAHVSGISRVTAGWWLRT